MIVPLRWAALAFTVSLILQPIAAAAGPVSVRTEVLRLLPASGPAGEQRLEPLETALPGDQVVYRYHFDNAGTKPAENVVVTTPIPEQTHYVEGTALGSDATAFFSVDGTSFARPDALWITQANGKRRLARPEEYTHVRWRLAGAIPPESTRRAQLMVTLR